MNEKEQSSIEWLIEQLGETGFSHITDMESLIKEAKQLHKKEIIDFGYLQINYIEAEIGDLIYKKVPEEIYNEKYST